jgi:hypothetical protein
MIFLTLFLRETNLGTEKQGRIQLAGLLADLEKKWITQKLKECAGTEKGRLHSWG